MWRRPSKRLEYNWHNGIYSWAFSCVRLTRITILISGARSFSNSIFFNTQANNVNSLAIGFYQTNTYFTNTIIQYFTGNADGIDELAQLLSNSTGGHITKDQFITILNNLQGALTNLISLLIDDSKFGKIFDAITFTAGIGENADWIRSMTCEYLGYLGITIDEEVNANTHGEPAVISTPDSRVKVCVIPTNEELAIARETLALVK